MYHKVISSCFCYQFCWNYQNVAARFFRLKNSSVKTGLKTQERTPSLRTLKKYLSLKTQAITLNNLERTISRIPLTSFITLNNFCLPKKKKKKRLWWWYVIEWRIRRIFHTRNLILESLVFLFSCYNHSENETKVIFS